MQNESFGEKEKHKTVKKVWTDAGELWTEALGDFENEPILLIAGAGAHAHFWTDSFCAPFLSQGFFVIRFDHRDVGLSLASQEVYDLEKLAQDVISILEAYHLSDAHIIGHAMGGYVAQQLAAVHPSYVKSLTILSAGPLGHTPSLATSYSEQEKWTLHETWRELMGNRPTNDFQESLEGFMQVWKRLNGGYSLDEELAKNYTQDLYTRTNFSVGANVFHMQVMQKVAQNLKKNENLLSNIQAPTLIIQGQEDYLMLPRQGGQALAEAIPHAELDLMPRMGHTFFNKKLETQVAERILTFLKES